ncbi:MAG: hypothetical protein KDD35_03150 [Bdellovibrionales bacterium]|nr:hypothetical protein [Bdellovibrionales bacterium]
MEHLRFIVTIFILLIQFESKAQTGEEISSKKGNRAGCQLVLASVSTTKKAQPAFVDVSRIRVMAEHLIHLLMSDERLVQSAPLFRLAMYRRLLNLKMNLNEFERSRIDSIDSSPLPDLVLILHDMQLTLWNTVVQQMENKITDRLEFLDPSSLEEIQKSARFDFIIADEIYSIPNGRHIKSVLFTKVVVRRIFAGGLGKFTPNVIASILSENIDIASDGKNASILIRKNNGKSFHLIGEVHNSRLTLQNIEFD